MLGEEMFYKIHLLASMEVFFTGELWDFELMKGLWVAVSCSLCVVW